MISTVIKDIPLSFETAPDLFSPNAVDAGTLAMLSCVDFSQDDRILDLGCGYGAVGITAAKIIGEKNVIMCDVSETAVQYSKMNAALNQVSGIDIRLSNGFEAIPENNFSLILSNPPYHTDFSVAKHFIETGFKRLTVGGRMIMVTKRLTWYKNKLTSVFGGVKVFSVNDYYVFIAEKRIPAAKQSSRNANRLSKKLRRKYGKPV